MNSHYRGTREESISIHLIADRNCFPCNDKLNLFATPAHSSVSSENRTFASKVQINSLFQQFRYNILDINCSLHLYLVLDSNNKWPNVVFAIHCFSKVNSLKQKLQADNRNFSRAYHCKVFGRAVLPTEVAALQHLFQLVTRPVEDVLHVRRWILQIGGLVAVLVFGGQAGQVGQVVDVGIGKSGKAETVDVADGHGGEHHLRGGLLVQRRDVRMLQVGDGTLCRLV